MELGPSEILDRLVLIPSAFDGASWLIAKPEGFPSGSMTHRIDANAVVPWLPLLVEPQSGQAWRSLGLSIVEAVGLRQSRSEKVERRQVLARVLILGRLVASPLQQ